MIACVRESPDVERFFARRLAGYTRMVLLGRGMLWLMIALVIALIFYTAGDEKANNGARIVFSKIKEMGDIQNIMKKPHYHGLDEDNLPYTVTADQAIQQDADTVLLTNIKADMENKDHKWLALHAGEGVMKIEAKQLTLTKDVDMFYDGGYEFRSNRAFIDIGKGSAHGNLPITGQGPMGTLNANSFSVLDRGSVIYFEGAVKVVIYRE